MLLSQIFSGEEGEYMTTNPFMIMVVNMTIVFAVLFLLGIIIDMIHKLDPTKGTARQEEEEIVAIVTTVVVEEPRLTQEEAERVDYETIMDHEPTVRQ